MAVARELSATIRPLWATLGDSNSVGVGSDGPWSEHAARALGLRTLPLAGNGDRAADVLFRQLPIAVAARPRVAGIFVGGNDVLRGDFDAVAVQEAVRTAAHRLVGVGAEVLVVLPPSSLADHFPVPAAVRAVMRDRLQDLRAAIGAAVEGTQVLPLDGEVVLATAGRSALHVDRIHLSALGQRLLAHQAVRILNGHGLLAQQPISAPPPPRPPGYAAGWLLVKGTPWLLRRSRDFLPDLARILRHRTVSDQTNIAAAINNPDTVVRTVTVSAVRGSA